MKDRVVGTRALLYRNTVVLSASNYLSAAFNLAATAVLARQLAVEGFGALNAALVAAFLVFQTIELGVSQTLTKGIAQRRVDKAHAFTTVFSLRLALGGGALIALIAGAMVAPSLTAGRLLIALLGLAFLLDSLSDVSIATLRSEERMTEEALLNAVRSGLMLVGVGVWAALAERNSLSIGSVGLIFVVAALVKWGLSLVLLRPSVAIDFGNRARTRWAETLREALPLGVANLVTQLILRLDTLFVAWLRGEREAGLYSASYNVFAGVQIVWTAYLVSLFARSSRQFGHDPAGFWVAWSGAMWRVGSVTLAASVALSLLGTRVIVGVYGAGYADATAVLPFHLLANVFLALSSACGMGLVVSGSSLPIAHAHVIALSLHVALNMLLVTRYGFIGAGIAAVVTHASAFLLVLRAALARRAAPPVAPAVA